MASVLMQDIDIAVRVNFEEFIAQAKAAKIRMAIACTWRHAREQEKLYASGRTAPGAILTHWKPGESLHNRTKSNHGRTGDDIGASRAMDIIPFVWGKPCTNPFDPVWEQLGELGELCGLEWGGRWTQYREMGHFQIRPDAP